MVRAVGWVHLERPALRAISAASGRATRRGVRVEERAVEAALAADRAVEDPGLAVEHLAAEVVLAEDPVEAAERRVAVAGVARSPPRARAAPSAPSRPGGRSRPRRARPPCPVLASKIHGQPPSGRWSSSSRSATRRAVASAVARVTAAGGDGQRQHAVDLRREVRETARAAPSRGGGRGRSAGSRARAGARARRRSSSSAPASAAPITTQLSSRPSRSGRSRPELPVEAERDRVQPAPPRGSRPTGAAPGRPTVISGASISSITRSQQLAGIDRAPRGRRPARAGGRAGRSACSGASVRAASSAGRLDLVAEGAVVEAHRGQLLERER